MSEKWKSRKWMAFFVTNLITITIANCALFWGIAKFGEWSDFMTVFIASTFGITLAGNSADKVIWQKKEDKKNG